jgi:hypothetical protein
LKSIKHEYSISKSNKYEPITLGIDDHQYLNILWTEFNINLFHVNCPRFLNRGIKYDFEKGIYYLRILISDNAESTDIILKVEWNGIWDKIKVNEIKK